MDHLRDLFKNGENVNIEQTLIKIVLLIFCKFH